MINLNNKQWDYLIEESMNDYYEMKEAEKLYDFEYNGSN